MDQTTELVKKVAESISERPSNWRRIQAWLTAEISGERVSVSVFSKFPYTLELEANMTHKGNLDKLTIRQSLILRKAKKDWLAYRYRKISDALRELTEKDWHQDESIPTKDWMKKRNQELVERNVALAEEEMKRHRAKTSVISKFKGLIPGRRRINS